MTQAVDHTSSLAACRAAVGWHPCGTVHILTNRQNIQSLAEGTTKMLCTFFFTCLISLSTFSQDSTGTAGNLAPATLQDTTGKLQDFHSSIPGSSGTLSPQEKKKRIALVTAANIIGYSAVMVGLNEAWYKDYPQGNFHVFNDIKEWQQMDKLGHLYSAYAESKVSMELWRWSGISRKKRIWLGGMSGAIYQTAIEILDGFSTEWGWSWGDFAANIAGGGMLVAQELAWDEQRIQLKWSFHRKYYNDPMLNHRSDDLFGKSSAERFLKDYNGQTYWLSTTLKPLFPNSRIPAWLQVSIGTGAEGMFGGYENIGSDKEGNIIFTRPDITRHRQWFLAPDIDLTKIRTNNKSLKVALRLINIIKFPTPSLELSNGKLSWNWFHF